MLDDLAILGQLVWEETLAIIPEYLKFKETDRKIYEVSDEIGKDAAGLRKRAAAGIALKDAHQIYIDWLEDCVSVMFTARSRSENNLLVDHMKAVRLFFYRDPLWLKHLTTHLAEIITVFDARHHILHGQKYTLLPAAEMANKMLERLTQEPTSDPSPLR